MPRARRTSSARAIASVCASICASIGASVGLVVGLAVPAARADAPPPGAAGSTAAGRCTQYEPLLAEHAPPGGWDVALMSSLMWRESRCTPDARSITNDTGLLQINDVNHPYLRARLGEWVGRWSLADPVQNVRAAAVLCTYWQGRPGGCYAPWRVSAPPAPPAATPAAPAPATGAAAPPAPPPAGPTPGAAGSAAAGRCTQYEPLLAAHAPAGGWDVQRMSKLMWATSRCDPSKRWTSSGGLLRISDVNHAFLTGALGERVDRATLAQPAQHVRAAAALCLQWRARGSSCYAPWGGTG